MSILIDALLTRTQPDGVVCVLYRMAAFASSVKDRVSVDVMSRASPRSRFILRGKGIESEKSKISNLATIFKNCHRKTLSTKGIPRGNANLIRNHPLKK